MRIYKRATNSLDVLEHEHVRPMMLRINALIEDVQDITARARMVDDALRAKLEGVESALHSTKTVVQDRIWPVLGALRAVRAGLDAWQTPGPVRRRA